MIRLIEDCEVRELFNKNTEAGNSRYWYFNSRYYVFKHDESITENEEGAYIEKFQYPDLPIVNRGRFDAAFPYFGVDESTYILGFKATEKALPSIFELMENSSASIGLLQERYPRLELCAFFWIAGWWEAFGEKEILDQMVNPRLVSQEVESIPWFSPHYDEGRYDKACEDLRGEISRNR